MYYYSAGRSLRVSMGDLSYFGGPRAVYQVYPTKDKRSVGLSVIEVILVYSTTEPPHRDVCVEFDPRLGGPAWYLVIRGLYYCLKLYQDHNTFVVC